MNRRGFLGAILATGMAPAVCKAEWLMKGRVLVPAGFAQMANEIEKIYHWQMRHAGGSWITMHGAIGNSTTLVGLDLDTHVRRIMVTDETGVILHAPPILQHHEDPNTNDHRQRSSVGRAAAL